MPLQPNDTVGPYRIVEQIGAGGTAVVYRAHDDLLNRNVAIKLIGETELSRGHLRDEAVAHKKLTQDRPAHLVQLIDVVEDQRGLMLVSEFVNGPSLEQVLSRHAGPMDEARARRLLKQMAIGLAMIHDRGFLHLDVKPANVLLDRKEVVKLTDFGLTTTIGAQQTMNVGTVRYMAPELVRGQGADARADLYALGMIAYEMLAGRTLFDQAFAPVLRDQRNAAMRWVKWHSNPRTTAPPLASLNPNVSPPMAELVDRLMAKDPQHRVASARELIGVLDRLDVAGKQAITESDSEPDSVSPSQPPSTGGGDTAPVPRTKKTLRMVAITVASLAILAGGGYGLKVYLDHQAAVRRTMAEADQAVTQADKAYHDGHYAQAEQQYKRIAEHWPDNTKAVEHAQRGELLARGQTFMQAGQYDQAIEIFKLASDHGANVRDMVEAARQKAAFAEALAQIQSHLEAEQFDDAAKLLRQWQPLTVNEQESSQLTALGERLADRRMTVAAEAVVDRARLMVQQGRRDEAIAMLEPQVQHYSTYRPLLELYDKLKQQRDFDKAMTEAAAAKDAGQNDAALDAYRRAAAIAPSPDLQLKINKLESDLLVNEGLDKIANGDIAGAEHLFILALGKNQDNPLAQQSLAKIASANRAQGFIEAGDAAMRQQDFAAAVRQYENALRQGAGKTVGAKLREARVMQLLAEAQTADPAKARQLINQARELNASHPMLEEATKNLETRSEYMRLLAEGDAARDRSDFVEAKRVYAKAQKLMNTEQIRQRQDDVEYAQLLAQASAYIDQQQYAAAKAILRTLIQTRDTQQARDLLNEAMKQEPE